jgi:hypothetical protein
MTRKQFFKLILKQILLFIPLFVLFSIILPSYNSIKSESLLGSKVGFPIPICITKVKGGGGGPGVADAYPGTECYFSALIKDILIWYAISVVLTLIWYIVLNFKNLKR